jgi:hypothetical protein
VRSDRLVYRDLDHSYWVDGVRIIGVNEALNEAGLKDFSGIPPDVLENARQRGIAVHSACHFHDEDDLDLESLSPEIVPYVNAWARFKMEAGVEIVECETAHFHPGFGFAGRLDRVVIIGHKRGILDLKTYRPDSMTGVQLSAYSMLVNDTENSTLPMYRWGLWLKNTGKYSLHEFTDTGDQQIFLSCLNIAKFKKRGKK